MVSLLFSGWGNSFFSLLCFFFFSLSLLPSANSVYWFIRVLQTMDDLTRHWNCLSLSKREGDDICFKKDRCKQEFFIAALFLTRHALNMDAVARTVEISFQSESTTENSSVKEKQQERNCSIEEIGQNDRVYEKKKKGRLKGNGRCT